MTDEPRRVRVAGSGEVPPGEARVVEVAGRTVALFNVDGRYYAVDNVCPHRGGPLGEGDLEGAVVSCPWHAWRFCVRDGKWADNPRLAVDTFEVRVTGDEIQVRLASGDKSGR